jgi:hypothetical protein
MNLLLHNALKDLRAVRGPLGLWLGVLLADAELVIAVIEPMGTFEKALTLEGFVLPQMSYYK